MSVKDPAIPRAAMGEAERRWRSQLAQLVAQHGFIHGSLLERQRVCGQPTCRCTRGHKHRAVYLMLIKKGRTRQLYVPKIFEESVRQWVRNFHTIRELMDQVSDRYWEKVQKRQG